MHCFFLRNQDEAYFCWNRLTIRTPCFKDSEIKKKRLIFISEDIDGATLCYQNIQRSLNYDQSPTIFMSQQCQHTWSRIGYKYVNYINLKHIFKWFYGTHTIQTKLTFVTKHITYRFKLNSEFKWMIKGQPVQIFRTKVKKKLKQKKLSITLAYVTGKSGYAMHWIQLRINKFQLNIVLLLFDSSELLLKNVRYQTYQNFT